MNVRLETRYPDQPINVNGLGWYSVRDAIFMLAGHWSGCGRPSVITPARPDPQP